MAGKKSGESESRWREILRRQAKGGLSIRGFCAAEGISEPSFYAWRKKLREKPVASERGDRVRPSRREQSLDDTGPEEAGLFVPVKLVEHAARLVDAVAMLEIVHPLGYRIQVTGDVNRAVLRQVIETLDERGT